MSSKIKVDQITTLSESGNVVIPGNVGLDGSQANTAWKLPVGTTAERPSGTPGEIRFNTTDAKLEFYNGTEWFQIGPAPFDLYDSAQFDAFVSYMQGQKTTWAASGSNFQYQTDASDTYIGDAQSDMYDSGNYTQVRVNGNQSGNIGYNSGSSTYNNVRYKPLGYSWPLVAIAVAPTDASTTYGWSRSGNLGADGGGGSPNSVTVYNGDIVSGFTVHAWLVNKSWNQSSDPGVSHLYCTVGQTAWSSSVSNGFTTTDYAGNSDSDYSYYQSTSTNCFVWTALLSKGQTNGDMSQADARGFVDNFLASARTHFG